MNALPPFDRPIAHRGLHDRANGVIENSASAFDAAIAANYHFECDLQLTGDDKAVVFHDPTLERLTGQSGSVRAISAGQMTRIPLTDSVAGDRPQRFEDMLAQVAGRTLIVVELKHQRSRGGTKALAEAAAAALAAYDGPVVVESFDPFLLTAMRAAGYKGPLGIIVERNVRLHDKRISHFQVFLLRHMLHWPLTRFSFISCHHALPHLPMVRFWRARGMPVTMWTVRSRDEAATLSPHSDQIVFEGFVPELV